MKQKPKELDWEKEFDKKYKNKLVQTLDSKTRVDWNSDVKEFIKDYALTQQRTKLLEEIKNELEVKLNDGSEGTDYQEGWDDACLEWDLLLNKTIDRVKRGVFDKNINLLNKKDE